MTKGKIAFTLIELLVVIAIIGILSGLIVVSMSGITGKASVAKAQVFSNSLKNSLLLNLVVEWKFDGNADDSWSSGYNGTLNNFTHDATDGWRSGSQCVSDGCLKFDGVNDYVSFSNTVNLKSPKGTISYWIYPISLTGGRGVFYVYELGGQDYLRNYIYADGRIDLVIEDNDLTKVNVLSGYGGIPLNTWTNVAWVQDGTSIKLYLNGVPTTIGGTNSGLWWTDHLTAFTTTIGNAWAYFYGSIDDIRVFNAAMPVSQIKEQYYSGLNNLLISGQVTGEEYREKINSIAQQ